jgi:ABC-type phosphate transport system substrate-binding protein
MQKRYLPILFAGAMLSCLAARAQEVAVIVNSSVKASSASADDIRAVFTGDKTTLGDGSHVAPVILKSGTDHEAFLKTYVGKGDAAYRTAWRSLVFTGQGSMPKTVDSDAAMVDYVAATPGAIGYVAKAGANDKVKTLTIK